MRKNNCCIRDTERYHYEIMTKNQVLEAFGQEYLDDFGHILPDELIQRYTKVIKEFNQLQKELQQIKEES